MSTTFLPGSAMRRASFAAVTVGLLVLTGCGGGDDEPTSDLTTDASSSDSSTSDDSSPSESESEESESPTPSDPETVDVFDITVGDCLSDEVGSGEVSEAGTIDCASPHDGEVYLSVIMDDADTFPGQDAVDAKSQDCIGQGFTDFVGLEYNSSALTASTLTPTEASWDGGDREILCIIADPAGPVTGSLQGANR